MAIEPGIILRKEEVLKRITEEQIFEKYLQLPIDEGVSYCNPLRADHDAGCRFYRDNFGKLRFKDFSKGYNWDCFAVVQFIYGCNFIDALRIIAKDFTLNTEVEKHEIKEKKFTIKVRPKIKTTHRAWNQEDIDFWSPFGIDIKTLIDFEVYPLKAYWYKESNDGNFIYNKCPDITYGYFFGIDENGDELWKLYFPKRTKVRFITNVIFTDQFLQGYKQLPEKGELLVITKSYKDVIALSTFNIPAIAPQSESQIITLQQFLYLTTRFPEIVTLADNDSAGRLFAIKHFKKFAIPYLIFPWTMKKDFTDNIKEYGIEGMKKIVNLAYMREHIKNTKFHR